MGARTTLGLLVVVVALGGVLLLTREKPEANELVTTPVLGGHSLDQARKIRWAFAGFATVEIRRDEGQPFRLTEPIDDLASVPFLRQIAAAYDGAQLIAAPLPEDPAVFAQTGLDKPELVFEVEFFDGQQKKLEIGALGPLGRDRFARADGKVWRIDEALLESLRLGIDDLRDRQVFVHQDSQATALTVERLLPTGGRETIALQREGMQWLLLQPVRSRADLTAAQQFVRAVLTLRIDQFPASLIRPPQRDPDWVVKVQGGLGDEEVRLWQDDQQNVFGQLPRRRNLAFVSNNREYARVFAAPIEQLRAQILVPYANLYQDIAEVVVDPGSRDGGKRLRLGRDTAELPFVLREPIQWNADPTEVNKLLTAINNLRAQVFVAGSATDPQFGLRPGGLQIGVRAFQEPYREWIWIRLGAPIPGQDLTYAGRSDEQDQILGVPAGAAGEIARPWATYAAREVLRTSVPPDRLVASRGDRQRVFVRVEDGWKEGGEGPVVRSLRDVVDELRDLRAASVRVATDFGEPHWQLELCRPEGDVLGVLRIWDRGDEAPLLVQAPAVNRDLVFELDELLSPRLRELAPRD
ncbi:MAG: DUF4340 domain-containing protein [Planctomycetes bacterium]|nr:DUF4340 domain-containing protein [Planctomycetota bacterium]